MLNPNDASTMIFAAGFGTRMGDLTQKTPKPLLPFKDRKLIDFAMDHVMDFGSRKTVVNAHYLADQVIQHFTQHDVTVITEYPEVLETGGGLKAALPILGTETVITMNSDTLWVGPNPITILADAWKGSEMDALLLCVPTTDAVGHKGNGDFSIDGNGQLAWNGNFTYTGVQIINASVVKGISENVFSLKRVWDMLIKRGRAFGCVYPAQIYDIGTKDSYYAAQNL
jgi:MurNAc alpha-1-phosphate uridylyltransferase